MKDLKSEFNLQPTEDYFGIQFTENYFGCMKKQTHGGKRKGSGRPKKERTVVMRIPKSKVKLVKQLLKNDL